jgi:hypothetical protein
MVSKSSIPLIVLLSSILPATAHANTYAMQVEVPICDLTEEPEGFQFIGSPFSGDMTEAQMRLFHSSALRETDRIMLGDRLPDYDRNPYSILLPFEQTLFADKSRNCAPWPIEPRPSQYEYETIRKTARDSAERGEMRPYVPGSREFWILSCAVTEAKTIIAGKPAPDIEGTTAMALFPPYEKSCVVERKCESQGPDFYISREEYESIRKRVRRAIQSRMAARGADRTIRFGNGATVRALTQDPMRCPSSPSSRPEGIPPTLVLNQDDMMRFHIPARRGMEVPVELLGLVEHPFKPEVRAEVAFQLSWIEAENTPGEPPELFKFSKTPHPKLFEFMPEGVFSLVLENQEDSGNWVEIGRRSNGLRPGETMVLRLRKEVPDQTRVRARLEMDAAKFPQASENNLVFLLNLKSAHLSGAKCIPNQARPGECL